MLNNMELQEFKTRIQGKIFRSTVGGIEYEFIPENTLRIKNDLTRSVHYEIKKEDERFVLYHNSFFGTEPILIEIIPNTYNDRLELTLTKIFSKDFEGTWIEQTDFLD
jgi:hypothetical protein